MANAKPILYGVSDFVLMRTKGAYYIDRTAYIRELENTQYVMFLRPRRFGKSLLVSMLQCYYDVHYAARFDELFGGLAIHDDPTPEQGKYLILDFNFTGVEKQVGLVQDSFNDYCPGAGTDEERQLRLAALLLRSAGDSGRRFRRLSSCRAQPDGAGIH